jgi:hypothetical protein
LGGSVDFGLGEGSESSEVLGVLVVAGLLAFGADLGAGFEISTQSKFFVALRRVNISCSKAAIH